MAHGIHTRAIHGGLGPDPVTGAILTPIYQTTTYVHDGVGRNKGFTYSRKANPTVAALERCLGELEEAPAAVAFGTGMGALTTLCVALLRAGDHVVVGDVVYGGTARLFKQVLDRFGVRASFVDIDDAAALARALERPTRLVLVETPANPTLKICDLAATAKAAHAAGALFAVDNTFLTAALQQPLALGADLVLYSTTKYVEGHNGTLGGAVVARDEELLERLRFTRNALGTPQSPFEGWLTLRGLKTLPARMRLHSEGALRVARWLETHPRVERVRYPWLESFPGHATARRQQRAGGGIVAFEVAGGLDASVAVMNSVKLCSLAESLGAVETLITHPASTTHSALTAEERAAAGIPEGLIRLSVGLEDPEDLCADLARALEVRP